MPDNTILDEAKALVYGDRQADYGHPAEDHARLAGMVNALYADRLKAPFDAVDMEAWFILGKLARLRQSRKRDTIVDIAGYAATMELTAQREVELWDADREANLRKMDAQRAARADTLKQGE